MTTQPEHDHLHHLLDRARRGVILPAEAEQLNALVAELEKSAAINAEVDAKMDEQLNGCTEVAQYYKALAERTQKWGEQHRDRANRYQERADAVRAELTALNGETRGLNPYAMAGRRDAPRVVELEAEVAKLVARLGLLENGARVRSALLEEARDALESAGINEAHGGDSWPRLAAAIEELAGARDRAEAALERIRQLHHDYGPGDCAHCTHVDAVPWPCPTIQALNQPEGS
ncbi:hypothetical protein ACFQ61_10175 [Streptomyces sp. NPDC056500]|uniref:hypothetical protein n=1 Tax=Streptomyces sp. NPDC056500 TaxID=3345840 RepID=UPI0036782EE2